MGKPSMTKMTRDELFLIKLHELTGTSARAICRFEIGRAIGQNDKGANIIARDLAQANFVKKGEGESVYLTDHGRSLVATLILQGA